ncbi:MAG: hypothetical protein FI687_00920 [SAR202 cluster bacterium]|nr:hypothetical protein [SAR202 cluster bacterium]|tara:strand:+ start:5971 stop:6429 length:459 start_codon:yes stop_codon:yes gene_type:complete
MRNRLLGLFSMFVLVFVLYCGGTETSFKTAVLKQPTAQAANQALSSKEGPDQPYYDLPVLLFPSYTEALIRVKPDWRGGGKEDFCSINQEEASEISLESNIEVIGEASCFYSVIKSEENPVGDKYFTGLLKIRIISTGQEGWIWASAIEFVE